MKKTIITTAATIMTSAMVFLSASPVTAFAATSYIEKFPTSKTVTVASQATDAATTTITKEQALKIALDHAGYKKSDIIFSSVEKDYDDGKEIYEVEFRVGFIEYNYDIAVSDGQIVEFDIDD